MAPGTLQLVPFHKQLSKYGRSLAGPAPPDPHWETFDVLWYYFKVGRHGWPLEYSVVHHEYEIMFSKYSKEG